MTGAKRLGAVYLVFGEDEFLVDQEAQRVIGAIRRGLGGEVAIESADCEEADLEGTVEEMLAPSLFAMNKVTVLRHFALAADSKLAREIEQCLASGVAPGQYLVMVADKVDRRLKLAKTLQAEGNLVEARALGERDLRAWIGERFAEEGKTVAPGVPEILLDLKGDDLRALDSEIKKVVTYVGDEAKVTGDHLRDLVGRSRSERVFDLVKHILEGKLGRALEVVSDLLDSGESGVRFVPYVGREIRHLIQVKLFVNARPGLWDPGMTFNEFTREVLPQFRAWVETAGIAQADTLLGQHPYAGYRRFIEAQRCDVRTLTGLLEGLLEANRLLVHTSVSDKVALETFVSAQRAGSGPR